MRVEERVLWVWEEANKFCYEPVEADRCARFGILIMNKLLHAEPLHPLRFYNGVLQQWVWYEDKLGWAFAHNVGHVDYGTWKDVPVVEEAIYKEGALDEKAGT